MQHATPPRWPVPFAGLRGVTWSDAPREITAGLTLAALMVPLNIGYAQVAGLPPTVGLYAAIVPLVVFALFTSSRNVITSPDASVAALVGAAMVAMAAPDDATRLQYALALALLCGVLFFVLWLFRLAFLSNFLSHAVLVGYLSGLGAEVFVRQVVKIVGAPHEAAATDTIIGQVHEAVGASLQTTGFFLELADLVRAIPNANLFSVGIGLAGFLIVRIMKRRAPKIPGALVALVLLTIIVAVFGLDKRGVAILGDVPSGLPSLSFPTVPLSAYVQLLPAAISIVAITLCEGLMLVGSYSRKNNYKADGNQALFAYGAANAAAALTGSFLTGTSPSRSAAMESAGMRSQWPSLVAAGTITLIMLFFSGLLAYLPNAALAGIVASAVLSLVDVSAFRHLWNVRRSEFWIATICFSGVLVLGPMRAVIIATLLAIIDVIRRVSQPDTWLLAEAPGGSHLEPLDATAPVQDAGLIVYRFGAALYFANANAFLEEIEQIVSGPQPPQWFVLDGEAMVDMDTTGAETLNLVLGMFSERGTTFGLSRANPALLEHMERYGLLDLIEAQRIFATNRHALEAYRREVAANGAQLADAQNPDANTEEKL